MHPYINTILSSVSIIHPNLILPINSREEENARFMESWTTARPAQRIYVDFVPPQEVVHGNDAETLLIELPGFKKEDIKIQINNYGKIRITGECQMIDQRWSRFIKEFQVPDYCNVSEISAKFEEGLLYIILPKLGAKNGTKDDDVIEAAKETKTEGSKNAREGRTNSKAKESEGSINRQLEKESESANKELQKVKEKEEDQMEESRHTEVTSDAKLGEGGANDTQKTESMKSSWDNLKKKVHNARQLKMNAVAAIAVLLGLGIYATYKLKESMLIDG